MPYILLVDPNEVAGKAMKGILARGNHRLARVGTAAEAWDFIQRNVGVDLVFVELKLEGDGGLSLVKRLQRDPLLKLLPVVIYTGVADRDAVRQAVECKVQKFLVKPYRDELILAEVAKALENPWRNRHFEEEKSFCVMMGFTPDALHKSLAELRAALEAAIAPLQECVRLEQTPNAASLLGKLIELAEGAGAWGVVELLTSMRQAAEERLWQNFAEQFPAFTFAEKMIDRHLDPEPVPEGFVTEEERDAEEQAKANAVWFNAVAENRCPVVAWPQLALEIDALTGCPVIDSSAASFQMSATGHPSSLAPLMDLAEKDPGLSAHLLVAANQMRRNNSDLDPEPVENPRICVGLLGEIRLAAIASGLVTASERMMDVPPCNWTSFWIFQVGVAKMAQYTCRYLEFNSLEPRAYAAGLLHDLGKLLLVHLHPAGFRAILDYAKREVLPLSAAEQKFLGCTTREMAAHFAEKHGLLPSYANVMRWVDAPVEATEDTILVASVSLARELCRQNRVGWSGEFTANDARPIAETPGWQVLKERVFPSFDLEKFEAEAHAECRELKMDLQGLARMARV